MEMPRNTIWERTADGDVKLTKYVGDPGSPSHRVLWEHTYTKEEFTEISTAMLAGQSPQRARNTPG